MKNGTKQSICNLKLISDISLTEQNHLISILIYLFHNILSQTLFTVYPGKSDVFSTGSKEFVHIFDSPAPGRNGQAQDFSFANINFVFMGC